MRATNAQKSASVAGIFTALVEPSKNTYLTGWVAGSTFLVGVTTDACESPPSALTTVFTGASFLVVEAAALGAMGRPKKSFATALSGFLGDCCGATEADTGAGLSDAEIISVCFGTNVFASESASWGRGNRSRPAFAANVVAVSFS